MTSWTANYGDSKTNSDSKHLVGGGGFTGGAQQSSGAVRLFCGAAQWWAHATALLFEPTELPPPGGISQVNCGLGVVMICQCRSTVLTHVALWCRWRSRGRLCTHVMVEDTWENS